ncbi:VPLPA-CTERM sorting domain-containing protein [Pacificoceanicola onchidii]|uniref:VPLPA-CTERM sorting domain-containing protein n=1 Tax=Pacificoceanicola onchidii TaxID=2562685 RepID=UPI001F10E9F1|nr:VPLPA-CTERM sorting domain-containing protein [Pacificoceanicola onchidii]
MHLTTSRLLASLAFTALLPAAASAATFTATALLSVEQEISVTGAGDPNYQDPGTGDYIFFDEYRRILTEEATVWDPSQIPAAPPVTGDPFNISSTGTILLTFGLDTDDFDPAQFQFGTYNPETGSGAVSVGKLDMGVTANISYDVGGGSVSSFTGVYNVYASNNFDTGNPGLGTIDVLFIEIQNSTRLSDGSTSRIFSAAGFDGTYFESLTASSELDLTAAFLSYLEVRHSNNGITSGGDIVPLFDEQINGFGAGFSLSSTGGGTTAPVPLPAALPMLLAGLGGLAFVRRRRKS